MDAFGLLLAKLLTREQNILEGTATVKRVQKFLFSLGLAFVLSSAGHVHASLVVGDNVRLGGRLGITSFDTTATLADPGIEFDNVVAGGINAFDLDVQTTGFSVSFNSSVFHLNSTFGYNEIVLDEIDGSIASAIITFSSTEVTPTLTFSEHSVTLRWASPTRHFSGERVDVAVTTSVPEPGTPMLVGLALAGALFARRRRGAGLLGPAA